MTTCKIESIIEIKEIIIKAGHRFGGDVTVRAEIMPMRLHQSTNPEVMINFPLRGETSRLLVEMLEKEAMVTLEKQTEGKIDTSESSVLNK